MGKPEILIGKSNGLHLSVWKASEIMGCDLYFYAQDFHPGGMVSTLDISLARFFFLFVSLSFCFQHSYHKVMQCL